MLNLANNVFVFQKKLRFLEFAEARYDVPGDDTLMGKAFPEEEGVPLSVALKRFTEVFNQLRAQRDAMDSAQLNREVAPLSRIMEEFDQTVMLAQESPCSRRHRRTTRCGERQRIWRRARCRSLISTTKPPRCFRRWRGLSQAGMIGRRFWRRCRICTNR